MVISNWKLILITLYCFSNKIKKIRVATKNDTEDKKNFRTIDLKFYIII